jgi:hypothetical protein
MMYPCFLIPPIGIAVLSYACMACCFGMASPTLLLPCCVVTCCVSCTACSPHFGFAHALCLGLAPWLAAEVPYMVEAGVIAPKV